MNKVHTGKLTNGIHYVCQHNPAIETISLLTLVRFGSGFEERGYSGIAHLLEHLLFKGTSKRPTMKIIMTELDSMGCEHNAYTSKEFTGYHIKMPKQYLQPCLDIQSDMLLHTNFKTTSFKEEFLKEKKIVLEELLGYQDRKSELTISYMEQQMFPKGTSLANNHFTNIEDLPNQTLKTTMDVYKQFYVGKNTFISIYGNLCANKKVCPDGTFKTACSSIEKLLETYYGSMPTGEPNTMFFDLPKAYTPQDSTIDKTIQIRDKKAAGKSHINISFRYPSLRTKPQLFSYQIMQLCLANLISGRLFQQIRERDGLVYSIRAIDSIYDYAGFFSVYTNTNPKHLDIVIEKVKHEVLHMIRNGITKKELEIARNHLLGSISIDAEDSMNLAQYNGYELFYSLHKKKAFTPYLDNSRIVQSLTLDEVNKRIQAIDIDSMRTCIVRIGN